MSGDPDFTSADKLAPEGGRTRLRPYSGQPASVLVIRPELTVAQAKETWLSILDLRDAVLLDPATFDVIGDKKEINRTGATRLAGAFGLSIEQRDVSEGTISEADSGATDYRYRVVVRVGKGSRFVDGIGSCRLSEIAEKDKNGEVSISKREHFALSKAWTRATKRAIADILGGTEVD